MTLPFQSSRPLRGATGGRTAARATERISILAPLAGRDGQQVRRRVYVPAISILAPLAGRDSRRPPGAGEEGRISILAPLAGRDYIIAAVSLFVKLFQSSRPLRGATSWWGCSEIGCGISILAPLAGRDLDEWIEMRATPKFQSSRPLRGATTELDNKALYRDLFQSSRPLRGATAKMHKNRVCFCNNRQRTNAFSPVKRRLSGR